MLTSPSQAPTLLGRVLGQDLLYSSYPLKPHCFFCSPGQTDLLIVLQYYPLHCGSQCQVWGFLHDYVSVSLLPFCIGFIFCCAEAIWLALYCSSGGNRCNLLEELSSGAEFRVFLCGNLGLELFILVQFSYGLVLLS